MRKLIESTFMSLDGAIDNPQNWSPPYWDDEHAAYGQKLMSSADELLLGRKTYEGFAEAWPQRSGDPFTDKINAMPKHVATRTLTNLTWNAQPLQGDAVEAVAELKQRDGGDLLKYGTGELTRTLLENGSARRAARLDLPRARRRGPAPDRRDRRHPPRARRDDALRERHRRQRLRTEELGERRDHRPRLGALVDDREAVALVELPGRVARLDAEAETVVAGVPRLRDQLLQELVADSVAALRRARPRSRAPASCRRRSRSRAPRA